MLEKAELQLLPFDSLQHVGRLVLDLTGLAYL